MASLFFPYIAAGRDSNRVQDFTVSTTAGETSLVGEFAVYDQTDNRVERCGANPAAIGVLSEVSSADATLITDDGKVPFYKLTTNEIIAMSSTTTPAESYVGDIHGITRASGGQWQLDTAKVTTDARMKVHSVDITAGIFYCQMLADYLQFSSDI